MSLGAQPQLTTLEAAPRAALDAPPNRLILGDALDVATRLASEGLSGKVDLVYVDPPFASQADYIHEARLDGPADGRVVRSPAYVDTWRAKGGDGISLYLDALAPRLEAAARLLAPTGSLWVHLDWRAAYLVRVLLDQILGRDAFVNEIVWRRAPNLGRQAASNQFGRTLDTIVVYGGPEVKLTPPTRLEPIDAKAIRWDDEGRPFTSAPRGDYTDASIARLDKEGRVHRTPSGRVYVKYFLVKNDEGVWCRERRVDALWTDVPPLRHALPSERTGYPTQKPLALLERIVACAAPPGGLVVDLFSGSGTTADAAQTLGRRFIASDAGSLAISTSRARLLRRGAHFVVESCGEATQTVSAAPLSITASRAPSGELTVTLEEPLEPAAWAIDADARPGQPFCATWSSERIPGAKPKPCQPEALIPRAGSSIAVRVYADDGSVATRVIEVSGAPSQLSLLDLTARAACE